MDDDGSKSLDFQEFEKGLENYGVSVGREKAQQIFAMMDKDGSGSINFDEFLEKLRVRSFTIQSKISWTCVLWCHPMSWSDAFPTL